MLPPGPLVGHFSFFSLVYNIGDHRGSTSCVATRPTCRALQILFPAMQYWVPPRKHGLWCPLAHLWATCDSAPHFEALGSPRAVGVTYPPSPLMGHL